MTPERREELSKAVSYALRHRPWEFELELDPDGWVRVDQLVDGLRSDPRFADLTRSDLEELVATAPRRRHELIEGRIRAVYGHSAPVVAAPRPVTELGTLYHGTSRRTVTSILREGLRPRGRRFVHLSSTIEIALQVGRRKDPEPVLLEVDAARALEAGIEFYRASDEIVLVAAVPPEFVRTHYRERDRT